MFALNRAMTKIEAFYGVLEKSLEGRNYLVGDKFSIADLTSFNIIEVARVSGVDLSNFPNLQRWTATIE